jgi:lipopolysaccharide transport system ATP-binding protein
MSPPAILAEGLAKVYRLGQIRPRRSLKEALTEAAQARMRAAFPRAGSPDDSDSQAWRQKRIWALQGVSLRVEPGEVVGIIGRNGAGKSTLLKILTRITEPTQGWAEIRGRIGSLLEVGIGFHPDLTGRENVYLNGAILGMKKAEIDRKFDEIVAFSEIERFLDTPVKRYSTGMHMRLAFSVAAYLESEILLVDEVLAVGDEAFQRKCMGKMDGIAREGRTILFVSHNLHAVQRLCQRALWLDEGRIRAEGNPRDVVAKYLAKSMAPVTESIWEDIAEAPGNDRVRLRRATVRPVDGVPGDPITLGTPFLIEVEYWNLQPGAHMHVSLHLVNEQGVVVFKAAPVHASTRQGPPLPAGLFRDVCHVPANLLNDGMHRVELLVARDHSTTVFRKEDILIFEVLDTAEPGVWLGKWHGAVRPLLAWSTELLQEGITPQVAALESGAPT